MEQGLSAAARSAEARAASAQVLAFGALDWSHFAGDWCIEHGVWLRAGGSAHGEGDGMTRQLEKGRPPRSVAERHTSKRRIDWLRVALRHCPVFSVLDERQLEDLLQACTPAKFPRRGLLYEEGAAADSLYLIASGRVRVVRAAGASRTLTVAYSADGELLGETALPDGQSYRATASATEAVEAVRIPLRAVLTLLARSPAFSQRMLALMIERRLEAERRVESLLSRSVESRVAEFLLDAADRNGVPDERGILIAVRYTHQEIADYVGSTRETVTLTLGELKRQALLSFDHRRIVITQRTDLAKIV
jgi:CRP/FNR family cyclic AMP-dependent transcriptional regulator